MDIVKADIGSFETVRYITQKTIDAVYPRYYPRGAVEFFKAHHSDDRIREDIRSGIVYLLYDEGIAVGTVTVKHNEINRLFVLPACQHKGYGRRLLDFAEGEILKDFEEIVLDASLPAKAIYLQRGYTGTEYHRIPTPGGDFLCYDVMKKHKA